MAWYLIKLYYIHESAIQRPNMNTKTNTDKVPTTHLYLVSRQVSSFSIWPVRMSQLRYPWYVRNPNTSRFSKYLKLQHKGVVDNNNNSDIALYPVKIYELAVLYIINTVHYQHCTLSTSTSTRQSKQHKYYACIHQYQHDKKPGRNMTMFANRVCSFIWFYEWRRNCIAFTKYFTNNNRHLLL